MYSGPEHRSKQSMLSDWYCNYLPTLDQWEIHQVLHMLCRGLVSKELRQYDTKKTNLNLAYIRFWANALLHHSLEWRLPAFHVAHNIDEFGLWPVIGHFFPEQTGWFNYNIVLVGFPHLICQFWKANFLLSVIIEYFIEGSKLNSNLVMIRVFTGFQHQLLTKRFKSTCCTSKTL